MLSILHPCVRAGVGSPIKAQRMSRRGTDRAMEAAGALCLCVTPMAMTARAGARSGGLRAAGLGSVSLGGLQTLAEDRPADPQADQYASRSNLSSLRLAPIRIQNAPKPRIMCVGFEAFYLGVHHRVLTYDERALTLSVTFSAGAKRVIWISSS